MLHFENIYNFENNTIFWYELYLGLLTLLNVFIYPGGTRDWTQDLTHPRPVSLMFDSYEM